jgi:4-hydroxy-tetrahydrodipicolinate synthase
MPYNIPSRTGVNLMPEMVAKLSKIKNIVGIKEASGSIKQMSDIIDLCSEDFVVLSGDDIFTLPLLAMGGAGIISVVSNVVPSDMAGLVDAFAANDIVRAKKLHHKMSALIEALFIEVNPVPVKAALALMGKIKYEYRLPLCKMAEANFEKLKKVMVNYALI